MSPLRNVMQQLADPGEPGTTGQPIDQKRGDAARVVEGGVLGGAIGPHGDLLLRPRPSRAAQQQVNCQLP